MTDPAEEFEAVWAVVRRLEAQIRRHEASIADLHAQLAVLQPMPSDTLPGQSSMNQSLDAAAPDAPAAADAEATSAFDLADGPVEAERSYRLVFDGGSLGNPGRGYGSFHITSPHGGILHERLTFDERGDAVTNNQAEYLTLISALDRLQQALGERARTAAVEIHGDSQLVVNQLNGRWKVRNEELRPLFEQARALLARFGRADLRWHARANSVDVLGH